MTFEKFQNIIRAYGGVWAREAAMPLSTPKTLPKTVPLPSAMSMACGTTKAHTQKTSDSIEEEIR